MAKPYSIDLRERVVGAVEQGGLSCHQAAAHFGVAVSTAINWVRRLRETGSVAPGRMGGHKPRTLAGGHRDWLLQRAAASDFTLRGLVAEAGRAWSESGLPFGLGFCSCRRAELQKKASCHQSKIGQRLHGAARSGRNTRIGLIPGGLSLLTRHGPRPIWLPCAGGVQKDSGFAPRLPMGTGAR